ncbi:MAG: glycosyltransferase [Candidatus Cloacimonetes bacterium]|nr:glycosyltransferase [Candidatus Cloacimonadota bacterium]
MDNNNTLVERKKTILFVLPNLEVGGYERITLSIIRNLDPNAFNVSLLLIEKKGYFTELIPEFVEIIDLRTKRARNALPRVIKSIRKLKPDIVFSTANRVNILVIMASIFVKGFKTVIREPSLPSAQIKNKNLKLIYRVLMSLLYPRADKVVSQTDEMKNELIKLFHLKPNIIEVITNPIDLKFIDSKIKDEKNPFGKNNIHVVTIGRISYEKGYDILLESFGKVVKKNNRFKLHFVGKIVDINYKRKLDRIIFKYNLKDNVNFLGFKKNPYPFLKHADLFVLSSIWEGLPNVVLEALYLKKPVIATKCVEYIEKIFIHNQGSLVDVGDVDGLANAILNYKRIEIIDKFKFETKYDSFFEGL